jgi:hypothetical protein
MRHCASMLVAFAAVLGVCILAPSAMAQTPPIVYRLDPGTVFRHMYCLPPCACPSHETMGELHGGFVLVPRAPDPLFDHYDVVDVNWVGVVANADVHITGSGTYRIGGEVARTQQMVLDLVVDGAAYHFDSGTVVVSGRLWPHVDVRIDTEVAECQQLRVDLLSSPGCYADCDAVNPGVDVRDFLCFLARFGEGDAYADCDGNGHVDVQDFLCYLAVFAAGCG